MAWTGAAPQSGCVDFLVRSSFDLPELGTFGNLGKGSVTGPGVFNWDAGLLKGFPMVGERFRAQFRAEYFNLTNRANFNNPNMADSAAEPSPLRRIESASRP